MLVNAKKVIGLPVIEAVGLKKVGTIRDIIVDPDTGAVLGFSVRLNRIFSNKKVVSSKDVREIFANGILVNSHDMVIDSKEVYKIDGVLKKGLHFLRSRVYTQNGVFVGIMEDLIFDGNINQVISIITKKPLSEETRIINASRILSVLPGKIIVRDVVSHVRKTVFSRGASIASPLKA